MNNTSSYHSSSNSSKEARILPPKTERDFSPLKEEQHQKKKGQGRKTETSIQTPRSCQNEELIIKPKTKPQTHTHTQNKQTRRHRQTHRQTEREMKGGQPKRAERKKRKG
jgi:hypothetical protein